MRFLITAGPTREHIDPVRYLSNGSSGKMGYALAEAARARGGEVELVSGPVAIPAPVGVTLTRVISAADMHAACEARLADADVFIAVAAVADYRPKHRSTDKAAKVQGAHALELEPTVDILKAMGARRRAGQVLIGFAAETSDLDVKAPAKLAAKGCDWIVANDVSAAGIGMDADDNAVSLWNRDGLVARIGPAPKREVARRILDTILGANT